MTNNNKTRGNVLPRIRRKFNHLVFKARTALFTEAAVPRIIAPAVIGTGFLAATWVGLWTILPLEAKIIGVVAFAAAAAIAPLAIRSGSLLIRKKDAIKRLDSSVDSKTRPAETLAADVTNPPQIADKNIEAKELYDRHLQRTWNKWGDKLKVGRPRLNLNKYDPLRLRFVLPLFAAMSAFHAGDNRNAYLQEAFNWQRPIPPVQPLDIRAWVSPPGLPHLAPQYLDTAVYPAQPTTEGESAIAAPTPQEDAPTLDVTVHEGSVLTVIVVGNNAAITVNGEAITPSNIITGDQEGSEASYEYQVPLAQGRLNIDIEGHNVWSIDVTSDDDPNANIVDISPDEQNPSALRVICQAGDDYGVEGGQIILRAPQGTDAAPSHEGNDGATATDGSSLDSAQLPTISLPRGRICTP